MRSSLLRVIPKTYKLFLDNKALKGVNPYLNVSSGSYANMSKFVKYEGDKPNITVQQEARNQVFVELRDAETGEILGKNQIDYDSLPDNNATFEEIVPLKNQAGEEIGEAVLEVQVRPRKFGSLFWSEQAKLEGEKTQEKSEKYESKQTEESKPEQKKESEGAKKEEATMKQESASKEQASESKAKPQEVETRDVFDDIFPQHRDIFYEFERTRREMDRIFHNFERIFGDRVFSGFSDEFRRVMKTFDKIERSMLRDFENFMLPFRSQRSWYVEEGRYSSRRMEGEKKPESKAENQENPKEDSKKEQSSA
jgi:hypothetical protein